MAIELSENADAKLLDVRVSGKLTAEDYGSFEPAVEALIGQVGKIHILFVMHDFHGWEMGAVWEISSLQPSIVRTSARLPWWVTRIGKNGWQ